MTELLRKRPLGRTGIRVTSIGIGTSALGTDSSVADPESADELAVETLRTALRRGLNYIDTAPGYRDGNGDRWVGMALQDGWRDRVVLATKVGTHPERPGDMTARTTAWTIEQSLEVLGTDTIDIALVHDPSAMDPVMERGGAVEALERLKAEGTVRAIGLGVQNQEYLRVGIESGRFDVIQSPYDYNLVRTTSKHLIDLAHERRLGVINASPFLAGLLSGGDPMEVVARRVMAGRWQPNLQDVQRARLLWKWSTERGVDLRALAIQFCLRNERITTTLIGPRRPSDMVENIVAAIQDLATEDWHALEEALRALPPPGPGGEDAVGPYPPSDRAGG